MLPNDVACSSIDEFEPENTKKSTPASVGDKCYVQMYEIFGKKKQDLIPPVGSASAGFESIENLQDTIRETRKV